MGGNKIWPSKLTQKCKSTRMYNKYIQTTCVPYP
jgi:hypothetical protein